MEGQLLSNDEDFELWILLYETRDKILKVRYKELSPYGITPRQASVMLQIKAIEARGGKATPADISRRLLREHHTVSSTLNTMEKGGLVSKVKDPKGRGMITVSLTEKGERAISQSLKRESIKEIMSCLSDKERQQLDSILRKLQRKALDYLVTKMRISFP